MNVRLSAQRALLGRVSPEVRVVTVECGGGSAVLRVYHDGPLAPGTAEEFEDAVTEIMADVPPDEPPEVRAEFERADAPSQVGISGWPVFAERSHPPLLANPPLQADPRRQPFRFHQPSAYPPLRTTRQPSAQGG